MKTRKLICAAILFSAFTAAIALGQGATAIRTHEAAPDHAYVYRQPASTVTFRLADGETEEMQKLKNEDRKLENEIQAALREYARTEEDSRKNQLRGKLSEALQQQFELRQQMRDREIAALEEQIKRLRDVFEKRAAAKQRIVEARLDQLLRAAEGLGWDASVGGAPRALDPLVARPVPVQVDPVDSGFERRR